MQHQKTANTCNCIYCTVDQQGREKADYVRRFSNFNYECTATQIIIHSGHNSWQSRTKIRQKFV